MEKDYTKQDIMELVEDQDVEFIRLQFVDIFGSLKNLAVTTSQLEKVLNNECMFDGAAIQGFIGDDRNYLSDLFLKPQLDTFAIFPWRPQVGKVARLLCDVVYEDGTPFEGDSRYVLRKVMKQAKDMGYDLLVQPHCEFFLFDTTEDGEPTVQTKEKGEYFDIGPIDQGQNARREAVLFLEDMNFEVESSYHASEVAQHGIGFAADTAMNTADNVVTFKMVVRTVAKRHGMHATFMPKPRRDLEGSGMKLAFSLFKNGKNVFEDPEDENNISATAYHFMAGIMEHVEGMALINNPIVNSYKRFVPGYNAPVKISCSLNDREAMIRMNCKNRGGTKLEFRNPDSASNPYLVLAVCLAAGLEGIKNKSKAPKLEEQTFYSDKIMPKTLEDAIKAFEKDQFLQDVLGKHIVNNYLEMKKEEWNRYCEEVTRWEVKKYLNRI